MAPDPQPPSTPDFAAGGSDAGRRPGRVAGKTALVTGAAQGLGAAIARMLHAEGARVLLTDRQGDKVAAVAAELGDGASALAHDVTEPGDWERAVAAAETELGGLHVLVNNAGIMLLGDVEQLSLDEWRHVHAVDLDSVFLGCKAALPAIRQTLARAAEVARSGTGSAPGGSIVNISSIAGIVAGHNTAAYNSAKAAVAHLSKSVALACAKAGDPIRCNSVHPAFVATPILDGLVQLYGREEAYAKLGRQIPLGQIGEPADVAYAVLYLASDESRMVTGTELVIDGGLSAM